MNARTWLLRTFAVVTACSAGLSTLADVPRQVSYQGRLLENGQPVAGPVQLTLSLYDAAEGGTTLFTEAHADVVLANGVFSLNIGSQSPSGIEDQHLATTTGELWLGVSVNGEPELTPRTRIVMVPFAAKAKSAEQLVAPDTFDLALLVDTTGNVGIGTTSPDVKLTVEGGSPSSPTGGGFLQLGGSTGENISIDQNDIMARNNGVVSTLFLNQDGGNVLISSAGEGHVGIGTSNPVEKLHVHNGNIRIDPGYKMLFFQGDSGSYIRQNVGGVAAWASDVGHAVFTDMNNNENPTDGIFTIVTGVDNSTSPDGPTDLGQAYTGDGVKFKVQKNGYVGIGTDSPENTLDVNGEIRIRGHLNVRAPGSPGIFVGRDTPGHYFGMQWSDQDDGVSLHTGDDAFPIHIGPNAISVLPSGNVGIGTPSPNSMLHVVKDAPGSMLEVADAGAQSGGSLRVNMERDGTESYATISQGNIATNQLVLRADGKVGIGTAQPDSALHVAGTTKTDALEILTGSDLAELFEVDGEVDIEPGLVVCIDPDRPGQLRVSDQTYDLTVAGIISGANGLSPGVVLRAEGTIADGTHPVALSGRVYCWCDTDVGGPIKPGDLLTTSVTPGHAMNASDRDRAFGATIGKAMTGLERGKGLVLVLVSLQ